MFTVPAAAWEIPVPEPVPEVVMAMFGCACSYAGAHRLKSG
jgi:hypothetical protein